MSPQDAEARLNCQGTFNGWIGCERRHGHKGECGWRTIDDDADVATTQPVAAPREDAEARLRQLADEPWFRNLQAVRELVSRQASRGSRAHLLAAVDEAIRRLAAPPSEATPPAEPRSDDGFLEWLERKKS